MKVSGKSLFVALCAVIASVFAACNGNHKNHQENQSSGAWPEMNSFHTTMAAAYHPFKDSADLKPAKDLAGNLADESETWAGSKRPDNLPTDAMTDQLMKLKTDCRTFSDHVKSGGTDADLGKELTQLHELFHKIMEQVDEKK